MCSNIIFKIKILLILSHRLGGYCVQKRIFLNNDIWFTVYADIFCLFWDFFFLLIFKALLSMGRRKFKGKKFASIMKLQ